MADPVIVKERLGGKYTQDVLTSRHHLLADEPESYGSIWARRLLNISAPRWGRVRRLPCACILNAKAGRLSISPAR